MRQPASIFNDVIGPVMIGPSSSHTAASVRIGKLIREMTNGYPEKVSFEFSQSGVIAYTYHGQGSDFGLSGGLLGHATDDKRIVSSLKEAADKGIEITFSIVEEDFATVSLYRIKAVGGGRKIETEIDSLGGGMIEIISYNGIPVSIGGGFYEILIIMDDSDKYSVRKQLKNIQQHLPETALAMLCENQNGKRLINIKSELPLDNSFLSNIHATDVVSLSPVLPILSRVRYPHLFNTAAKIEAFAAVNPSYSLADIAIMYESTRGTVSENQVLEQDG